MVSPDRWPPPAIHGSAHHLVCDYYVEVGLGSRLKRARANVPADRMSDALFDARYEPEVLMKLPEADRPGVPFSTAVPTFCFPVRPAPGDPRDYGSASTFSTCTARVLQHGVRLATAADVRSQAIPVVTSFVLTAADT